VYCGGVVACVDCCVLRVCSACVLRVCSPCVECVVRCVLC
jgi:hypothetical protein